MYPKNGNSRSQKCKQLPYQVCWELGRPTRPSWFSSGGVVTQKFSEMGVVTKEFFEGCGTKTSLFLWTSITKIELLKFGKETTQNNIQSKQSNLYWMFDGND